MQPAEIAEAFHVAFLNVLAASADPRTFAVKGGANLRFYLGSLRYSEDIDLDAFVDDPRLFSQKLERAIRSRDLARLLDAVGIKMGEPNNKDRAQANSIKEKWNFALSHRDVGVPVPTRVEMSYRSNDLRDYIKIERMPAGVAAQYSPIPAPTVGHYVERGCLIHKIRALENRRETQPRDVFDLDYLFRRYPDAPRRGLVDPGLIGWAIGRLFEIGYPEYRSKVLPFLDSSIYTAYASEDAWINMHLYVSGHLEDMGR